MSLHSSNHFTDAEFKSGAMMWFSSTLDTNSPWGTPFPLSVPVSSGPKREVGVVDPPKPPVKSVQQLFATNEFVQVASNQRWNTQNVRFGSIQPEMNKKAVSKVVTPAPAAEQTFSALPTESEPEEENTTQNLYKTEYCRSFEETGSCRYGLKCQFAHGDAELRPVTRHPKYKTEVCKTFHSIGTCPYGKRCRFIHIEAPTQQIPSSVKVSPQKSVTKPLIENINGAGWSNNWNGSFPTSTTNVNSSPVVAAKGLPPKVPVDQFASLNISKEPTERKSRLGIFQQICS